MFSKILREEGCKVVLGSDGPDEFLCGFLRDMFNYNFNRNNFLIMPYHKNFKRKKHYEDIFIKLEKDTNFFSKPDERYSKILKYLDAGQFKALTYATKSLPEYINIRGDKGYMLNSIEIRQPYLSKKIVEFLCALPSKFRISKDKKYGKIFLREQIRKKLTK